MKKQILVMMVVLGIQLFPANIHGTVIDFEILGAGGNNGPAYLGTNTYTEDGYTLTTNGEFGFIRLSQTNSIALFSGGSLDIISLAKNNGEVFDLVSINYLHVNFDPIVFTGTRSDATAVTFTKNYNSNNKYSTIVFSDFTDLVSVSWQGGGGYNHFDNITVIPEPTTLFLFSLGTVFLRRQFKKRKLI